MTNGANAGKIAIVPKGDYNRAVAYEKLNLVTYKGESWIAKKPCVGIEPNRTNSAYWHRMAGHTAVNNLTTTEAGFVLDARQGKILMDAINETNSNLEAEISERESAVAEAMEQIAQIANNQIPQEYLESAVDAYVTENSGGFATRDALDTVEADLKSDLSNLSTNVKSDIFYSVNYPSTEWEAKGLVFADGTKVDSTTRSIILVKGEVGEVECDDSYKFALCAYNGANYVGAWNGSEYIHDAYFTKRISIPNDNYTFYVVLGKSDDATISTSDYSHVTFKCYKCVTNKVYEKDLSATYSYIDANINRLEYIDNAYSESNWNKQGIVVADGTFVNTLIRANRVVDKNTIYKITCTSTYRIALYAYDGLSYIGTWNGTGFDLSEHLYTEIVMPSNNYTYYVVFRKVNDGELVASDFNNCIFTEYNIATVNDITSGVYNKFYGKRYAAIGDSITYGFIPRNYVGYPGQLKSFAKLTAERLNMDFNNYGISGSTVAIVEGREPMCQRFSSLPDNADVITVMGGTNDVRNNVPLGSMSDRTGNTFYGALHVLLGGLYKKYFIDQGTTVGKTKTIIVCTPLKLLSSCSSTQGGEGTLVEWDDWINAIKQVAEYYSFPVLDFYNLSGINPHLCETVQGTETGYTGFYNPYITDGTHPTQEGADMMSDVLIGFLNTL